MAANPAKKIPDSGVKIPAFRSLAPDSGVSVGRGVHCLMLHAKFQKHMPSGSGKEDF